MPTTRTPIKVYKNFMESLLQDTDEWKDLLADTIVINAPLARLKGKKESIEVHEAFYENVERSVLHVLVEHEDLIITQISTTIETESKKSVVLDMSEWYTIRHGKIEEIVVYFDASVLRSTDKRRYDEYIQQ